MRPAFLHFQDAAASSNQPQPSMLFSSACAPFPPGARQSDIRPSAEGSYLCRRLGEYKTAASPAKYSFLFHSATISSFHPSGYCQLLWQKMAGSAELQKASRFFRFRIHQSPRCFFLPARSDPHRPEPSHYLRIERKDFLILSFLHRVSISVNSFAGTDSVIANQNKRKDT